MSKHKQPATGIIEKGKGIVQYLRIVESKQEVWGMKYFKFNWNTDTVVQVTAMPGGDYKRGRTNCIGITIIGKTTLFSNYMAMKYVEQCTKKEYEDAFNKIVNALK